MGGSHRDRRGGRRGAHHALRPAHAPKKRAADINSRFLRIPIDDWHLVDTRSSNRHVLSFAWPDREYAVLMSWHAESAEFLGWYINLQSTLRRTPIGFDAGDHILDIVITHDRVWRWKDEHEMTQAIETGLFTEADAERFHAEGERVIQTIAAREDPFGDEWLSWSADPSWHEAPGLLDGWDVNPRSARRLVVGTELATRRGSAPPKPSRAPRRG